MNSVSEPRTTVSGDYLILSVEGAKVKNVTDFVKTALLGKLTQAAK